MNSEAVLSAARQLVQFVNKSPTPFHVVEECKCRLLNAGFQELRESEQWHLNPLDKCFLTRNKSTIIAFAVGGNYKPGNGFSIIGAHTDSPCLKVKPISRRVKHGYIQVGIETYGGGTWHTWFDRDLKLSGRVIVKNGSQYDHRLVDINRPILRVPNLCIHMSREMGTEFKWNKETHLTAVLATTAAEQLQKGVPAKAESSEERPHEKHHSVLEELLCEELSITPDQITDFELCLSDYNEALIGGALNEFVFSPRLDNLLSSYTALQGLIESCQSSGSLDRDPNIRLITLFDDEEIGSASAQGAGSALTQLLLTRICRSFNSQGSPTAYEEAIPKSLVVSCDAAHAIHPNYSEKHEEQHRPEFHKGMVVKYNTNQRYATTAITSSILREIAQRAKVPLQDFVIRQDTACGSTIGPIISAKLGIPVLDIGPPLLSMHSIREMCDTTSVSETIQLMKTFFNDYAEVYSMMNF